LQQAQDELHSKGQQLAGLVLFDQERTNTNAGWAWTLAHAGTSGGDTLLNRYANATAHNIGELRYDMRRERIPKLEAALAADRRRNNRSGESAWLSNLGTVYSDLGEYQQARSYYEQQLTIAHELGDQRGESIASWNLGELLAQQGDRVQAESLLQFCVDYERSIGHPDAEKDAAEMQRILSDDPAT
jgi:tetratricopeptide (TPR) repeat protein